MIKIGKNLKAQGRDYAAKILSDRYPKDKKKVAECLEANFGKKDGEVAKLKPKDATVKQ